MEGRKVFRCVGVYVFMLRYKIMVQSEPKICELSFDKIEKAGE